MSSIFRVIPEMIAAVLICGIPIIAILVRHQQKMAALMRDDSRRMEEQSRIDALRYDVDVLKDKMNQQTMLLDTIAAQQQQILQSLSDKGSLEQRLKVQ